MENDLVGVGIEPTFRVFQTRANPSQLSDRDIADFRLPIADCVIDSGGLEIGNWQSAVSN